MKKSGDYWSNEEIDAIFTYREQGLTARQIHNTHMPHRTILAIRHKWRSPYSREDLWTADDDKILTKCYSKGLTVNQIQPRLPARTKSAIRKRLITLKLRAPLRKPKPWTDGELKIALAAAEVRRNYASRLSKTLRRSRNSIIGAVNRARQSAQAAQHPPGM